MMPKSPDLVIFVVTTDRQTPIALSLAHASGVITGIHHAGIKKIQVFFFFFPDQCTGEFPDMVSPEGCFQGDLNKVTAPLSTSNYTSTGSASERSNIAGSVIGSVIVLLLLVGFALVMAVCISRRGKTMKDIPTVLIGEGEAFGNSKYSGVADDNSE